MKNEDENEKRGITPKKALEKLKAKGLDLTLEGKKKLPCEEKNITEDYLDKLTIEELRKCKGFDEISASDINEIIESLFKLAIVVYNLKE